MGDLTPIVPPLVSSSGGSEPILFCSTSGSDSAQGSDVSFTAYKGETLTIAGVGAKGTGLVMGILWDIVSLWWAVENVTTYSH